MHPSIRAAVLVLAAGFIVLSAVPAGAVAQSAPPTPADATHDDSIEIWQDEALPPDVPAGRSVDVAFTTWDTRRQTLSELNTADVRVHPAAGKARPTKAQTHSDWPGHLVTTITVPAGGLGPIEIGYPSQTCTGDGTCTPSFVSFTMAGVGPPPQAPRSLLVDATIQPAADPASVDQPFSVQVTIAPRASWDPTSLALPEKVVLIGVQLGGQETTQVDLRAVNDGHYAGAITLPHPGDTTLSVAFQDASNQIDPIDRSTVRFQVAGAGSSEQPAPSVAAEGPATTSAAPFWSDLPLLPIVAVLAVLLAASLVVRRAFADL
ncbi:MAG TPA: hypothetical protein VFI34_00270 [Candidatus Limnocylindrales bacterium]|nr:hypothetical protein [Candidatus Limnocylindrales bacterium]